jgi:signal transduction histidine kinase
VDDKKKNVGDEYKPIIQVMTRLDEEKVKIRIKDNGTGIPQKAMAKLFQPFFTTKPAGAGTGLGLSICYDIIKMHGGELKVKSIEGEETEFTIVLNKEELSSG